METTHKFDLSENRIERVCAGGSRILANHKVCQALQNMALSTIHLKKGGLREPHWHPNANELTYCLEGKALITLFSPGNNHDTFTLDAGEVVYFPKGYIHHIENISEGDSFFLLCYDHDNPQDLNLSSSISSMPIHAFAATFDVKNGVFETIKEKKTDAFISTRKNIAKPDLPSIPNRHKINLEKITPQIATPGGTARIASHDNFPLLNSLALFSLRIFKGSVREPHWHPNATELNYVIKGKARLTIFSPEGKIDTFELTPNQGSIIPAGYFHYIENIAAEELHMAVFFNHPSPSDIGLSGALSAYSKEVLGSLFSLDPTLFENWAVVQEDLMIVKGGG